MRSRFGSFCGRFILLGCLLSCSAFPTLAQGLGRWSGNGPFRADYFGGMAGGATEGQEILFAAAGFTVVKSTDHGVTWNATGLRGGYAVACDASGQTVYAACWDTVHKSSDGGQTWTATELGPYVAFHIAVDPVSPDTVYVGGQTPNPVLMKSTDGGATWQDIAASLPYGEVTHIEPSAAWPGSVLVCDGGVYLSQDGGARWVQLGTLHDIDRVMVHPTKPKILYAQSHMSGLWKSTNSGQTWKPMGLLGGSFVEGLLIDPAAPDTLYAGIYQAGLWRSKDGGKTWRSMHTPGIPYQMVPVLISPINHKSLYAHVEDSGWSALWASSNMGKTWTQTSLGANGVRCIATDPTDGQNVYVGCANGVYKSTDRGGTWRYAGLSGHDVNSIAVSPASPSTVYASSSFAGCYKSKDGGASWSEITAPFMSSLSINSLVIAPGTPEKVYVAAYGGLFMTSNGGATWSELPIGTVSASFPPWVMSIAVDSGDPDLLLAGVSSAGVARSSDGGASWLLTPLRTSEGPLCADPSHPGTFYAGGGALYVTATGGLSWRYVGTPGNGIQCVVVDGSRPGRIFTGLCEGCGSQITGVWESSDAGETWSQLAEGVANFGSGGLALSGSRLLGLVIPSSEYWGAYGSVLYTDTDP
jgi:photosystem II stability/assembly factor-like uncharacterized protein